MIKVLTAGEDVHRLEDDAGTHVGWIHGRALSFGGMRSEAEAVAAAAAAWQAFDAALRRHYFGRPPHDVVAERLRLVHDGAYEWVTDGRRPVARLYRPRHDRDDGGYSIELVLPSYASEGVAIAVAQVVGNALVARRARGAAPAERAAAAAPARGADR
ncbi:MAG: hypothetical protein ACJ79S_21385 [Gemmatimonadaceae bacterium]